MNEREAAHKLLAVIREIEAEGYDVMAANDLIYVGDKHQLDEPSWRDDGHVWELSGE